MDKFNFVGDGVIKLPPGFRFQPTDEELVYQYLKRKVFSWPLPALIIPEINVCKYDPWDFPGNKEQERYFFSYREAKYRSGNRINRATASGYWKATGLDKQIASSRKNHILGMKKTLVFYRGRPPHGSKTDWIMHEYRLVKTNTASNLPEINSLTQILKQMDNWVVCRILLKKRSTGNDDQIIKYFKDNYKVENAVIAQSRVVNFMIRESTNLGPSFSSSSSSSSSGITEVSSSEADHEDSSCCSIFQTC